VVSRARQHQAAFLGRVAQHDPAVFGVAGSVMEHPVCKDPRLAWIVRIGEDTRFISLHLRRDHDRGRRIEERHTVGDGGHVAVGEGDQTPGGDQNLFAGRRLPENLPVERPGLHIKPPVVAQQVRIGQPERLVIDEELDDLAVRHVDDGLPGLRKAIGFFRV
jgi:hypothetical protein